MNYLPNFLIFVFRVVILLVCLFLQGTSSSNKPASATQVVQIAEFLGKIDAVSGNPALDEFAKNMQIYQLAKDFVGSDPNKIFRVMPLVEKISQLKSESGLDEAMKEYQVYQVTKQLFEICKRLILIRHL